MQLPQPFNSDIRNGMTGRVKVLGYRFAVVVADVIQMLRETCSHFNSSHVLYLRSMASLRALFLIPCYSRYASNPFLILLVSVTATVTSTMMTLARRFYVVQRLSQIHGTVCFVS